MHIEPLWRLAKKESWCSPYYSPLTWLCRTLLKPKIYSSTSSDICGSVSDMVFHLPWRFWPCKDATHFSKTFGKSGPWCPHHIGLARHSMDDEECEKHPWTSCSIELFSYCVAVAVPLLLWWCLCLLVLAAVFFHSLSCDLFLPLVLLFIILYYVIRFPLFVVFLLFFLSL